ncbi:MAG: hypothetical protein AAGF33_01900 [Pseudomonadota bacterium]
MLLHHITGHANGQNWFAVAVEFVILIIGVFLGIQVANWNDARQDLFLSEEYLYRLHNELTVISASTQRAAEERQSTSERLNELRDYFDTPTEAFEFSPEHCAAIARSHIYAGEIAMPPSIDELMSTGRILLIEDENVRTAIGEFAQMISGARQLRRDLQIDRLPLARKHPSLVRLGPEGWQATICDLEGMQNSSSFLNDFIDNRRRYNAFMDTVMWRQVSEQSELLGSLSAVLTTSE